MKLIDTNVLIDHPEILNETGIVIHISCLEELDLLKHKKHELSKKIGYVAKKIRDSETITFDKTESEQERVDDKLLDIAKINAYTLITNDILLYVKASIKKVAVENYSPKQETYDGYKVVQIPNYILSTLSVDHGSQIETYRNYVRQTERIGNEYIICTDTFGQTLKIFDSSLDVIDDSSFRNSYSDTIRPLNLEQRMAIDLLRNEDIPVKFLTGIFGSGKDFLMINYALKLIEEGKFNNITWVRNNIPVKDSEEVGYLKGSLIEKILPYAMPLADHLGGIAELMEKIDGGIIQLEHLGFIRGRNIENSIIYCTEVENMTVSQIQLILSRVGKGSMLMMNGDAKQVDREVFKLNNTITRIVDAYKTNKLFGYVNLKHTERSEVAKLADVLG